MTAAETSSPRLTRAPWVTLGLTALGTPAAWRWGGRPGALGLGAGGIVAAVNFALLVGLVRHALRPRPPRLLSTAVQWIAKYLLLGAGLWAAFRLGADPLWFVAGITLFVLTIVIYGLIDARAS